MIRYSSRSLHHPGKAMAIAAGVCGGCLLFCLLGGFAVYSLIKKASTVITALTDGQRKTATAFMSSLQKEDYKACVAELSPSAKEDMTVSALKQALGDVQKKLGPIKSWDAKGINANSTASAPGTTGMINTYTYIVVHEKGKSQAVISFRSSEPLKPSTQISDFTIKALKSPNTKSKSTKKPSSDD